MGLRLPVKAVLLLGGTSPAPPAFGEAKHCGGYYAHLCLSVLSDGSPSVTHTHTLGGLIYSCFVECSIGSNTAPAFPFPFPLFCDRVRARTRFRGEENGVAELLTVRRMLSRSPLPMFSSFPMSGFFFKGKVCASVPSETHLIELLHHSTPSIVTARLCESPW